MILTGVAVAEAVVPKRYPVLRVVFPVGEEIPHQTSPLVRSPVSLESLQFGRGGQQSENIQKNPTPKNGIAHHRDLRNLLLPVIGRQQAIDRIHLRSRRKVNLAGSYGGITELGKGEPLLPFHALIDPGPHDGNLLQAQRVPLDRHPLIRIITEKQFDEETLRTLPRNHRRSAIASSHEGVDVIDIESPLALPIRMALGATTGQDGFNVLGKINLAGNRRRNLTGGHFYRSSKWEHQPGRHHGGETNGKQSRHDGHESYGSVRDTTG